MDPNDLRDCVEAAIVKLIEPVAWQRREGVNQAEQDTVEVEGAMKEGEKQ